jgi:hypothetical protein
MGKTYSVESGQDPTRTRSNLSDAPALPTPQDRGFLEIHNHNTREPLGISPHGTCGNNQKPNNTVGATTDSRRCGGLPPRPRKDRNPVRPRRNRPCAPRWGKALAISHF